MWFQRSQEKWIASGDRNTKYYHASTLIRRNRNRIEALKDIEGNRVSNPTLLDKMVEDFFKDLFKEEISHREIPNQEGQQFLSENQVDMLTKPVSKEAVKKALFEMAPFKSLRVDGFHAGFYQRMWDIVGDTLCNFVQDFLKTGLLLQGANDTILALILEVQHPEALTQLRSISLCNVAYKVITKTMTNKLKDIMASVISPNQCSFDPRDNVI